MKLGLRTIKTAISASLAIYTAQFFGLMNPASAGIIALLSLTATKKSTIKVGIERLGSLTVATVIASVIFNLVGFSAGSFGLFLLIFIMVANYLKLNEGIPVSAVLVSHYLVQQDVSWPLIFNAYALMCLGVGFALLLNLYMPNRTSYLKDKQVAIDLGIKQALEILATSFETEKKLDCQNELLRVKNDLKDSKTWAKLHADNFLFKDESYYMAYFSMRELQVQSLEQLNRLISDLQLNYAHSQEIAMALRQTVAEFSADNDTSALLEKIEAVYQHYRQLALPVSRKEFEDRAQLYHFLLEFEHFLEIKQAFLVK